MPRQVTVKQGDTLNSLAKSLGFNSYQEAGATGFKSGNPNLIYPNEVITFNNAPDAPAPAPAMPAPSSVGLPAELANLEKPFDLASTGLANYSVNDVENQALDELIRNARTGADRSISERDIRNKNIRVFQNQIDGINKVYDSLVMGAEADGQDRLGQGRAISNRQGLVGSNRGEAQRQNIVAKNADIIAQIQGERAFKVNSILGQAQQQALNEIAAEKAAKRQSAADYLTYISMQDQRRDKNLNATLGSMITQEITLDEIGEEGLQQLSEALRVSPDVIRTTYQSLLPKEDPKGLEFFDLSEGEARFAYNPVTGKVEEIASRTKTFAPNKWSAGGGAVNRAGQATVGNGSGPRKKGVETVDVLTFEEFKNTPQAKAYLEANKKPSNFVGPVKSNDALLKELYEKQVLQLEQQTGRVSNVNLGGLTAGNRRDLAQVGLLNGADSNRQSFFLNLPAGIRDQIQRGVAAGAISPTDLTIEEMQAVLDSQQTNKSSSSSSNSGGGGDLFDF